jgi:hypothetical protein
MYISLSPGIQQGDAWCHALISSSGAKNEQRFIRRRYKNLARCARANGDISVRWGGTAIVVNATVSPDYPSPRPHHQSSSAELLENHEFLCCKNAVQSLRQKNREGILPQTGQSLDSAPLKSTVEFSERSLPSLIWKN